MSQTNNFIFTALKIISWIIFVGLCIEAGGLLVNFVVSIFKPQMVSNLYQKLDLGNMYERSKRAFFSVYSFILTIAVLKAFLFYIVIKLVSKFNLDKPFDHFVANQILQISYYTFSIGFVSYLAKQVAKSLRHHGFMTSNLDQFWSDGQAFMLMAAVIYIIAMIVKKGIEIQTENDLTV